nr:unnamed protein product [Callosobruchus chinensis]
MNVRRKKCSHAKYVLSLFI